MGLPHGGKNISEKLNSGEIAAKDASRYALQFLKGHFEDAGLSAREWMELVEDGWRCAWEQFEGVPWDLQAMCRPRGMFFVVVPTKQALLERNGAARLSFPRSEALVSTCRTSCCAPP
jgi:hypothetical protein